MAKCPNCGAEFFPGKTNCIFCEYSEKEKIKTKDVFLPDETKEDKKEESDRKSFDDIQEKFEKKIGKEERKQSKIDEIDEMEKKYHDDYDASKDKKEDLVQKALAVKVYSKFTFPLLVLSGILFLYVYWMDPSQAKKSLIIVAFCLLALGLISENISKKMFYRKLDKQVKEEHKKEQEKEKK